MNRRDFLKTTAVASTILVSGGIVQGSTYTELPKLTGEVVAWYGHHKMHLKHKGYDPVKQAIVFWWELPVTPGLPRNLDCVIKCGDQPLISLSPHWRNNPHDTIQLSFAWRDNGLHQG